MSYQNMTDEELYEALKKADLADKFLESPQGHLLQEAANRIVEKAVVEFAICPLEEFKKFENQMAWRLIIRKYKFGLFEEIKQISRDGFLVWQELKNRHPEPTNQESLNTAEKGEEQNG